MLINLFEESDRSQRHSWRSGQRLALVALMSLVHGAAYAAPRDPAVAAPSGGLTVGASGATTYFRPVWISREGYVIAPQKSGTAPNVSKDPLACFDVRGTLPLQVGATLYNGTHFPTNKPVSLVARPGSATMYVVGTPDTVTNASGVVLFDGPAHVRVIRVGCGAAAVSLGDAVLPMGATLPLVADSLRTLPLAADGTFLVPSAVGLVRVDPSSTPPTTSMVLSNADMVALQVPGEPSSHVPVSHVITGLALAPAGSRWLTIVRSWNRGATAGVTSFVARLDASNAVHFVQVLPNANTGTGLGMVWSPSMQAMLMSPVSIQLGVIHQDTLLPVIPLGATSTARPAWPFAHDLLEAYVGERFLGFIGSADGGVYAVHENEAFPQLGSRVGSLGFDPARADFDRDGVSQARELALGLDDLDPDKDDDGVLDGTELWLGTDVTDAGSPGALPPVSDVLAQSASRADWAGVGQAQPLYGRIFCEGTQHTCRGPDGDALGPNFPRTPSITLDGRTAIYSNGTSVVSRAVDGGPELPITSDPLLVSGIALQAMTATLFFSEYAGNVTRWNNGLAHPVIDLSRQGCPVAATAADLTRCGAPDLQSTGAPLARVLGVDARREALLVYVQRGPRRHVVALTVDAVLDVMDTSALPGAMEPSRMMEIPAERNGPGEGWLVLLSSMGTAANSRPSIGAVVLDRFFRVRNPQQPPLVAYASGLSAWFKDGFLYDDFHSLWAVPAMGTAPPRPVPHELATELVRTPLALGPGDVIFFSNLYSAQDPTGMPWVGQDGVVRDENGYGTDPWFLGRIAQSGGMLRWLSAAEFTALGDTSAAASLATTRVGRITHLAVRDDASRVCLVEGGASRVWEVLVGPDGRPMRVVLTSTAAGVQACAYASDGRLGLLGIDPGRLDIGPQSIVLSRREAIPNGKLVRAGDYWLHAGPGLTAECIDDQGVVSPTGHTMVAVTAVAGASVAWIDENGEGHAGRAGTVCAGGGPQEHMTGVGNAGARESLWEKTVIAHWGTVAPAPLGASLVMRPDGLVLVATQGMFSQNTYFEDFVYRIHPQWVAAETGSRMVELDRFRRPQLKATFQSLRIQDVSTMALVPGGSTEPDDWEYFGRAPPVPVVPTGDAGVGAGGGAGGTSGDGGTGTMGPPMKACACSEASASFGLVALALSSALRRRRSGSRR